MAEAVRRGAYNFEQRVALKRVLPNLAAHPEFTNSLIREGKLASLLQHPGIAKTYDLGCVGGTYYIAMELVTGVDLRRILVRLVERKETVPVAIAVHILAELIDALDYAHTLTDGAGAPLGITHRDISPANVLLSDDGTAKLIDFGVAKATATMFMTTSGKIKGKFAYMAPEAMAGKVDHRVDLFGLGIIAYEMLTARPLFAAASDVDVIHRVKKWGPPSLTSRGVPAELDAIIQKALAKDPAKRWASAAEMGAALERVRRTAGMATSSCHVAQWLAGLTRKAWPSSSDKTVIAPSPLAAKSDTAATMRMDVAAILRAAQISIATPVISVAMPHAVAAKPVVPAIAASVAAAEVRGSPLPALLKQLGEAQPKASSAASSAERITAGALTPRTSKAAPANAAGHAGGVAIADIPRWRRLAGRALVVCSGIALGVAVAHLIVG